MHCQEYPEQLQQYLCICSSPYSTFSLYPEQDRLQSQDLLGVSRQTAVVAFQLGDAFTNLIVPTSGCLIGSLAIAKIEWSNWIKFMWKFLGVLMIGAIITVLISVGIGF